MKRYSKKEVLGIILGVLGSILLLFMSWERNMGVIVWILLPLLVYSFRSQSVWFKTIPVLILAILFKFLNLHGGWDIDVVQEIGFAVLVSIPLAAALYFDRYLYRKVNPILSTLVFPVIYVACDYLLSYSPVGMTFALAYTQSEHLVFIQAAGLFGSWFVGFLTAWFAPLACLVADNVLKLNKVWKPLTAYMIICILTISYGSVKVVFMRPDGKTVKVASITAEHKEDYWAITDRGTIKGEAIEKKEDMKELGNELFISSKKAADFGARVIFWSEGNYVVYEDDYAAFIEEAKQFAKANEVYFVPGVLVLEYGQYKNRNLAVMINPRGEVEFTYEKTISWYPTESDGIIHRVATPYGNIASVICFDMDFPAFIRQASGADIMLVPAFDTRMVGRYHTQSALMRGIEFGFSVVRQSNAGVSMAADYNGNILAAQDFFNTDERCMIADVPVKGIRTFYSMTGDWFAWVVVAGMAAIILIAFIQLRMAQKKCSHTK